MSQMIFYYDAMESASKNAEKAGEKLNDYAEDAEKRVAKKISSYPGDKTGNINSAQSNINRKVLNLHRKADAFIKYASDVSNFVDTAKTVDKNVEGNIKKLSGTFKSSYGIRDNIITKVFNWISDKLNESDLGRFFKDMVQAVGKIMGSVKDSIVDWYRYEGGKYVVDAILAFGGIVLAVAGIIVTVCSGAALIFIVAGVVAGLFEIVNAFTNIYNSGRAFAFMSPKNQNRDPAWARRYGDMDTLTDTMRKESNSYLVHNAANALDSIEFAANVITIVGDIKDLFENGSRLLTDVKNNVNSFGGLKNYVRHQYDSFTKNAGILKNAMFGEGALRTNAENLVKLSVKDGLRNFATEFKQIWTNTTISTESNIFSRGFVELFTGVADNDNFSGLHDLVKMKDYRIRNIAFVIDSSKDLYDAIGKYKPFAFVSGGLAGNAAMDLGSIADDIKENNERLRNNIRNISETSTTKVTAQMRRLLSQRFNAAAGGS